MSAETVGMQTVMLQIFPDADINVHIMVFYVGKLSCSQISK